MNLNRNSWYAQLYMHTYSTCFLPNNLCAFFWKMLLAVILLPITWVLLIPSFIFSKERPDKIGNKVLISFGLNIVGLLVYGLTFLQNKKDGSIHWYYPALGILMLLGVGIVIYIFVRLCSLISETSLWQSIASTFRRQSSSYKEPKTWIVTEFIKAKKNKYCPKITWHVENEAI